ncbi:cation:proton antiporter [Actinacidiphila bryophytorum]|uniref:Sodium/proton antiporter (CPA1 family) n=1 Tax=Actinacidiphila bryophytorum TaxID=1436133 RepID=A0A9W4H3U5_9ACTN|nr:cation:proton antiporter [Actinacidiphila bryophytorum]MBM9439863.1 cation:proton antiporter [Actinacidiphila bryophytorum]MBN6545700.1 cation:proton antiporter [Actinacidiphila bryophytorum]CAG7648273.1 Sodium/proton antiporter (CPA1 family) [Actinacidiphila bryophytorum]
MTENQVMAGLGLIVVLAVGSQLLASRLRVPALLVLLPAGFTAGALTDDVDPNRLLGHAFSPMVSLAVAVILYDSGLGLDLGGLRGHTRRVVVRLLWIGTLVTWVAATLLADPLLGMSKQAAVMLGAILVVSGPTVVGPLLDFVRPRERLQRILIWEGALIDPIGGILGALVFHGVVASQRKGAAAQVGAFMASAGIGLAGGVVGAALLWLLLRYVPLGEVLGTTVQLAAVVGVAAACDVLRGDTGLIAAVTMGMALANLPGLDLPARRPFLDTLVSMIIGLLFVSISATVTPHSLRHVVLPALALVAVLVLVVRPLATAVATYGTDLPRQERLFVAWMDPRGIVAASTASTFSATLVGKGIGGAAKILPATFVVIVATVTLYGLTAHPVARRLGVLRPARSRPLLVGGAAWVLDLARALRSAGLDVLMWAGLPAQREKIAAAGLPLAPGELLADASGAGAELEGVTVVLLLTDEDDFNALASMTLRQTTEGAVHRLAAPSGAHGVVAPYTGGPALFGSDLSRPELNRRYEAGARVGTLPAPGELPAGHELLFVVRADGLLVPVTQGSRPESRPGDTAVVLVPQTAAGPPDTPGG